jgi:hypothetical protein
MAGMGMGMGKKGKGKKSRKEVRNFLILVDQKGRTSRRFDG